MCDSCKRERAATRILFSHTVRIDLTGLPPDRQVAVMQEHYGSLRGTGAVVRARVEPWPVRSYISLLERGYRVSLEREDEATIRVLQPDGSAPRIQLCLIPTVESTFVGCERSDEIGVIDLRRQTVLDLVRVGARLAGDTTR